ncbi:MAG: bifunctional diaminohydroxyphosphoribosylaminopyrimidine deaminase/5-amino-6-(5-phosphoribosylamino)uracil reductase RibD [Thiotrichales bacterium]|nr:bifunctional diaminohydroxyphosphoribosylaminopyrimidine deaminase/5-amino-6-(5-phosphoribosylamino)uracil reductase RibD [Thiotrichales bacterium]
MERALELAEQGRYSTKPNPCVGCVLVKEGRIIGEGWHKKAGQPHAEKEALADASARGESVQGATAYVTLEPCSHYGRTPPCCDALIDAQVAKVWVAMTDPNPLVAGTGVARLKAAGVDVQVGLKAEQAERLNRGFLQRMRQGLPYVRLKMASSLDGRTAMASGESQWITGAAAREKVHQMRAQAGAVVLGIGTVLADDPSMNVRLSPTELTRLHLTELDAHPLKVVLDPHLSLPFDAKLLQSGGRNLVMTTRQAVEASPEIVEQFLQQGVDLVAVAAQEDRLEIEAILRYLAEEEQINDVLVESGAIAAGAFMQSGLVNELHVFIAPVLMGDLAKPMFVLPGLDTMAQRLVWQLQDVERCGEDLHLQLLPVTQSQSKPEIEERK